ncbi:hypothetical protein [Tychonema sp. LEGE 07203]|uniref:hypothetical protein n=1 Tax=Tychonema sp. LEGE 07203 TaxID=1828671 RepID=UPI00187F696C|nr:hypothetical protein [Tychonema sp. LEGE 07203]
MQNTCRFWGQSFYLPTQFERKLKQSWRFPGRDPIAARDSRKPRRAIDSRWNPIALLGI